MNLYLKNQGYTESPICIIKRGQVLFHERKDQNRKVALSLNGQVIVGSEMFAGDQMSTMSMLVKVCGKT